MNNLAYALVLAATALLLFSAGTADASPITYTYPVPCMLYHLVAEEVPPEFWINEDCLPVV